MLKKVETYVEKNQMLQSEDCVVVGVSGGADSVCLVLMLAKMQKKIPFRIVAVHVNHGLRGMEADQDEQFVKDFCEQLAIPCQSYFVDVESIAKNRKQSTEEAGRIERLRCFEEVCEEYGGTKIALAHHQNDNAETMLLNLARGSGLKGLGGMAPVKGRYIRPLLCLTREEIEAYLREVSVTFCTDATNESDAYTRNRLRNHILPYLTEKVNEQSVKHMNDTMEQLRDIQEYMEQQVDAVWTACVEEKAGLLVKKVEYQQLPDVLQTMLLHRAIGFVCEQEKDLESVHVDAVRQLFEKQSGKKIDLPYDVQALRVYEGVLLEKKQEEIDVLEERTVDLSGGSDEFQWGNKTIRCKILKKSEINANSCEKTYTKWFDYDIIRDNFCFRSRRVGDFIQIHPDGATQKLKSYFVNEKVLQKERDKVLLVAAGSHILWAVGYRQSCGCRVTAETKQILEIQVDEGEGYGNN